MVRGPAPRARWKRHTLLVAGKGFRENFQGNVAFEAGVFGAIHLPHAARAEGREDLVWTEESARE
jgi:hypothetical protein